MRSGSSFELGVEHCFLTLGPRPGAQFYFLWGNLKICTLGWHSGSVFNFQFSRKFSASVQFTKLNTLNKQLQGTNKTLADGKAYIWLLLLASGCK